MEQIIAAFIGVLGLLLATWLKHLLSLRRSGELKRRQTNQSLVAQEQVVQKEERAPRTRIRPRWVTLIISDDESRLTVIILTVVFGSAGGFVLAINIPLIWFVGIFLLGLAIFQALAAAWIEKYDRWPK